MNKAELIAAVAAKAGISQKDAGVAVAAVLDEIKDALKKGDKVQLVGFGSFEVRAKAARTGKNPRTGETTQQNCDVKITCQRKYGDHGSGANYLTDCDHSSVFPDCVFRFHKKTSAFRNDH